MIKEREWGMLNIYVHMCIHIKREVGLFTNETCVSLSKSHVSCQTRPASGKIEPDTEMKSAFVEEKEK